MLNTLITGDKMNNASLPPRDTFCRSLVRSYVTEVDGCDLIYFDLISFGILIKRKTYKSPFRPLDKQSPKSL